MSAAAESSEVALDTFFSVIFALARTLNANAGNCTALGVAFLSCGCLKRVVEAALNSYNGVNGTLTMPTGR